MGHQRLHALVGRVHGSSGPDRRYLRPPQSSFHRRRAVRRRLRAVRRRTVGRDAGRVPRRAGSRRRDDLSGVGQCAHQRLLCRTVGPRNRNGLRHSWFGQCGGPTRGRSAHRNSWLALDLLAERTVHRHLVGDRRAGHRRVFGRHRASTSRPGRAGADHRRRRIVHVDFRPCGVVGVDIGCDERRVRRVGWVVRRVRRRRTPRPLAARRPVVGSQRQIHDLGDRGHDSPTSHTA